MTVVGSHPKSGLTRPQAARVIAYFRDHRSLRQIAEAQGVSYSSVDQSLRWALSKCPQASQCALGFPGLRPTSSLALVVRSQVEMRRCGLCGRWLPNTPSFFRDPGSLLHHPNANCSVCRRLAYRDYNREYMSQYYRTNPVHREKANRRAIKWQHEHPEYGRRKSREWSRKHPEQARDKSLLKRARKHGNGGSHTSREEREQYDRQKGRCFYCHDRMGPRRSQWHSDHVMPVVRGGSDYIGNIVAACPKCNQGKHAKHPMDFAGVMF